MSWSLCDPITSHVLSYLAVPDLCQMSVTSKPFQKAASNDQLWAKLYQVFRRAFELPEEPAASKEKSANKSPKELLKRAWQIESNWRQGRGIRRLICGCEHPLLLLSKKYLIGTSNGCSYNGILLWDLNNYSFVHVFKGHTASIGRLVGDGDYVASSSYDETVRVWSLVNKTCVAVYKLREKHAALALDNDVLFFSPGNKDFRIHIKNFLLENQNKYKPLVGHTDEANILKIKDRMLFSGAFDGTIRQWDWRQGHCVRLLIPGNPGVICSLSVYKDRLASSSNFPRDPIRLWDLNTGKEIGRFQNEKENWGFNDLNLTEKFLVSTNTAIYVWDLTIGKLIKEIPRKEKESHGARVHFLGKLLVAEEESGRRLSISDLSQPDARTIQVFEQLPEPKDHFYQYENSVITEDRSRMFAACGKYIHVIEFCRLPAPTAVEDQSRNDSKGCIIC